MRTFLISILMGIILVNTSYGQSPHVRTDTSRSTINEYEAQQAKKIVVDFSTFLLQGGNIDSLLSLCAVPFVIDGGLITTSTELKRIMTDVMSKTSKKHPYNISVGATTILGRRKEILNHLIPLNVYFVVNTLKFDKNGKISSNQTVFAVQMSDAPKIIGINAG